jgi:dephospho-CoA kinase
MAKTKNLLVGITGTIGSGKSTLSRIYAEAGYPVLSADEFARELTTKDAPALHEIRNVFGERAIAGDGTLDRAFLRAEIIRDEKLRKKLELILHPKIQALTWERAKQLFTSGKALVFYEAPLLFEAKSENNMDYVICVHAAEETLIQRVMKRDKSSREHAEKLLASQLSQAEKIKRSDFVIENGGDEKALARKAHDLLQKILESTA